MLVLHRPIELTVISGHGLVYSITSSAQAGSVGEDGQSERLGGD